MKDASGGSIYQDFFNDAFKGFQMLNKSIKKYKKVIVFYQSSYMHPYASIECIRQFCKENTISLEEKSDLDKLEKETLYVCLKDSDLVKLVKLANQMDLLPGTDYGVLSYNDSPMKEIIHEGITVISTDFEAMGKHTAEMIHEDYQDQIPNPIKIIERNSI